MDAISNSAARYARLREEEMSIDDYLALCQSDPMVYGSAAQRMLAAIGEPDLPVLSARGCVVIALDAGAVLRAAQSHDQVIAVAR